jgi:hypothetical protein
MTDEDAKTSEVRELFSRQRLNSLAQDDGTIFNANKIAKKEEPIYKEIRRSLSK